MFQNKTLLKKAGLFVGATIASLSLLVAGIYDSPKEIVDTDNEEEDKNRIVLAEIKKDKRTLSELIEKIPLVLKVFVMIPLWLLGTVLLKLLAPFSSFIVSAIATFALLFLIVWIIAKLLFPNLKFRDIFNKRTLIILAVFSILIPLINFILSISTDDYLKYIIPIDFIFGILSLSICLFPLIKLKKKIKSIILPDEKEIVQ